MVISYVLSQSRCWQVLPVRPAHHPHPAGQAGPLRGGQHQPEEQARVVPAADLGHRLRGQVIVAASF